MARLKAVCGIFLITLLLWEFFGLFIFKNQYNWRHRYQFCTRDARRQIDDGLWTYRPNAHLNLAAVYGFPFGSPWLEYNCELETNQFGLTKTNSSRRDSYDLLVLGDSFTEGQGGCPWLTTESTANLGFSVLNGGLHGTGLVEFANMEGYLAARTEIRDVLILAISNDFFRAPDSSWIEKAKPCLVGGLCDERNLWWSFDGEFTRANLERVGRDRVAQRYEADAPSAKLLSLSEQLAWHSMSARLISTYIRLGVKRVASQSKNEENEAKFESNMAALQSLREKFPHLRLVLIPQRDEVGLLGGKNRKTRLVESRLGADNIPYERCELSTSDFMFIDGHPNRKGYDKLWRCAFEGYAPGAAKRSTASVENGSPRLARRG